MVFNGGANKNCFAWLGQNLLVLFEKIRIINDRPLDVRDTPRGAAGAGENLLDSNPSLES